MSTEPKMTPWFPVGSEPARIGVYQTENLKAFLAYDQHGYQHWNGAYWGRFNSDPESAALEANSKSNYQRNYWRGLASKP